MNALDKTDKTLNKIALLKNERNTYRKEIKCLTNDILNLQNLQEKIDKSNIVLQYIIENKQKVIIEEFEQTVTSALQEIFDENYSFKIIFKKRNKMSSVDFAINTGEYKGHIPIKMTQGRCVKEVIALALRVIFLTMLAGRRILVLDESFGGIDTEREHSAGIFLNKVCEDAGIQIIMVSHKVSIADSADNRVEI